jgi:hypothetical protein
VFRSNTFVHTPNTNYSDGESLTRTRTTVLLQMSAETHDFTATRTEQILFQTNILILCPFCTPHFTSIPPLTTFSVFFHTISFEKANVQFLTKVLPTQPSHRLAISNFVALNTRGTTEWGSSHEQKQEQKTCQTVGKLPPYHGKSTCVSLNCLSNQRLFIGFEKKDHYQNTDRSSIQDPECATQPARYKNSLGDLQSTRRIVLDTNVPIPQEAFPITCQCACV